MTNLTSKEISYLVVDAFAAQPFAGNPAAVCLLEHTASKEWMQKVAAEFNLPATAFLAPEENQYNLRWFSAEAELAFCGHGTLASTHVLWQLGRFQAGETVRFNTQAGIFTARKDGDQIQLNLPAVPVQATEAPPILLKALNVNPRFVARGQFDYIVEVENEQAVLNLKPDFALLKTLEVRGCIVTSQSDFSKTGYDIVSRCFFPRVGINEDPVTGSAHCSLAPYWHSRLNKSVFKAYQASARGGLLQLELQGERVILGGQAVTVMQGKLTV